MKSSPILDCDTLPQDCKANLRSNGFLSTAHRLFYVATPKVACTTLKWWFADLLGETDALLCASGSHESTPDLVIHDLFGRIRPDATGLSIQNINGAINASDYFRFCLVRNPYPRIFSAWQSKWLLHESLQVEPYRNFSFLNLAVTNVSELALAFEAFLEHLNAFEYPNLIDPHVKSQASLLCPSRIPYSHVVKLEDSGGFCMDLELHLGSAYKNPFLFGKRNESLISYHPRLITERSELLIRRMYAEDFDCFGYETSKPLSGDDWTETRVRDALKAVEMLRARNCRIRDMRFEHNALIDSVKNEMSQLQKLIDQQGQGLILLEQQREQAREEITRAAGQLVLLKELLLSDGVFERI
jgi:hypothetical protein